MKTLALQQFFKNPAAWSALASLGAHVLFLIVLPILPTSALKADEPEIQRSVDLVELSPAEQSRLPDFSAPAIELPPLAKLPSGLQLNPLTPSSPSSINPLPSPNSSLFAPPPPLPLFIPSLPPAPPPQMAIRVPPLFNQQPPTVIPSIPPTPSPSPDPNQRESRIIQTPQAPVSPSPGDETPENPEETPATPENSETPETPADTRTAEQIRQDQIAALAQGVRDQRKLTYMAAGTSNVEARESYTSWFERAVEWMGNDYNGENAPEVLIAGTYPQAACRNELDANAIVGVLVDRQGRVVEEPTPFVIRSSGYELFNEQAIADVMAKPFEATGKRQAYRVAVSYEFAPENCTTPEAEPQPESTTGEG